MAPSRHHHPDPLDPLLLSIPPLNQPIWSCMGEFCWRLWVARASNRLSLFCGTTWPYQWASRSSSTVDVWWASSLGIYSSSSFYRLSYFWGRLFKTLLFEEPLPHPKSFGKFDLTSQWFAWLGSRI
uniref:Uncharacterized protein n=1 Tax=Fagus sylvatica TaxID=28930 RepID=A0A2N9HSV1_FAGSY